MTNILIVEDEKALNQAYEMILEKAGYKVMGVYDGLEALEAVKEFHPDLILLDLRMPNMSGNEFLAKYDAKNKHPKVKIIVFSNLDSKKDIDEVYSLGATRYVLKAWASPRELLQLVSDTLKA